MSWWISLKDNENDELPSTVERFCEGGTYVLGGSTEAELNVTYNYSKYYEYAIDKELSLRFLHGKKAKDVMHCLGRAIAKLGNKTDDNYWKSTPGNAGHALSILLVWCKQNPNSIVFVE